MKKVKILIASNEDDVRFKIQGDMEKIQLLGCLEILKEKIIRSLEQK